MALVVEDGNGISNSDSYMSITEATDYHDKRGNTKWGFVGADTHEVALRVASETIDLIYGNNFLGSVWNNNQALLFPRTSFFNNYGRSVPSGTIPEHLKNATAEAALLFVEREVEQPGSGREALVQDPDPEANVKSKSEDTAGVISESVTYFKPVSTSKLTIVGMKLSPILMSGGNITVRRG